VSEAQFLISGEKELQATNTAEQILKESRVITGLLVTAFKTNTAVVRIGPEGLGGTAYPMEAGEAIAIDLIDISRVYVYGKEKDRVKYIGLRP
jgi:hypothetical protein